ncbi:ATP-dependent RecD-like DNA helicase [Desulfobacterales bacterium HSG16]|nr:ATP-dependent RecD-like DNA helicase [Desulfobacterales bacterium HSG16]
MLTELAGQIERITYANEENGFTIAKLKVYGQRDLVTIVGNIMSPAPGEIMKLKGEWANHPKFGEQFKVVYYRTAVPATVYGIQKYLGSGLIKGIGPKMAKRIVKAFGKKTLDVIEENAESLADVDGIGKKRIHMIKKAWDEQKEIREVMLFLQSHGVSSGYASKIYKHYGNEAISVVRENPYRLAMDIFGIGFITADNIAQKLGFEKESSLRASAGVLYVLHSLSDQGHVFYPYEPLLAECAKILEIGNEIIAKAVAGLVPEKRIVIEDLNQSIDEYRENNKAVYLSKFHLCETRVSERIIHLSTAPKSVRSIDTEKALTWVQRQLAIELSSNQLEAVRSAVTNKVLVITGGPGTGKTTIINGILKIFSRLQTKILLAAPTGRAAKRMSEACNHPAKTIHRLLEYSLANGGFQKNYEKPLNCDLLVIDEASMIDTVLAHHLLKAVPAGATLILVGDVNQLPSVGAGNVLKDIIASGAIPVARLTEIFRQAKSSRIIVNAHKINQGFIPTFETDVMGNDCFFIEQKDPDSIPNLMVKLVKERIPARFGFDPFKDIQVLTPMHKGSAGAGNLNTVLQQALNPDAAQIVRGSRIFKVGDKVMQTRNNYDKDVYNGDIGRIARIRAEDQEIDIDFDNRDVTYDYAELDEIILAYAVSVHKSQGSEYPAVVFPVLIQHYMLLQRNLIYTALTRGRKLVVMVGTRRALAIGVKNDKTLKRCTYLEQRLKNRGSFQL